MNEDIVKRLRFMGRHGSETERCAAIRRVNERNEAADLIEALRAPLPAEQPSSPVALTISQIECVIYALDAIVTEAKLPTPDAAHIENVANDVLPELRETWARIVGQQTKGGGK